MPIKSSFDNTAKPFVWGTASSSYQIEGAVDVDGRGPSIWDIFSHTPGKTFEGHTGDKACDHYNRYREDVKLMKELGVDAYRFSIAWPRVMPDGRKTNPKGLDFYDRLVDNLLESKVDPWVTLYHWDLPNELQRRGGWQNREMMDWFGDYAELMGKRLGDRVKNWITINEPPCIIGLGLQDGFHAPGHKLPYGEVLNAGHNLLLAHGTAVQALRAACPGKIDVTITNTSRERIPASTDPRDIEAARADYFACTKQDAWNLSWWADAAYLGKYPEEGMKAFEKFLPDIRDGDMERISQPLDFMGYNIYSGFRIRADKDGKPEKDPTENTVGDRRGSLDWLAERPEGMFWAAKFQTERYGLPIAFTENGICGTEGVSRDGKVHDPQRVDFLENYLGAVREATDAGIPVRGYFYWSVLDNYEWHTGYRDRFGLVHVDYETQARTPKDSYHWYQQTIAEQGANLTPPERLKEFRQKPAGDGNHAPAVTNGSSQKPHVTI